MKKIQELIEAGKKATQGEWKRPSLYNDYLFVTTDIGNVIADFNNKSTHHDKENADFTALAANTRTEIETLYTLAQEMAHMVERQKIQLRLAGYSQTFLNEDADKVLIKWKEFKK